MDLKVEKGRVKQQAYTKLLLGPALFYIFPRAYPYSIPCHHNQSSVAHLIRMLLDQLFHRCHFFPNPHLDEADDARMRQSANKH